MLVSNVSPIRHVVLVSDQACLSPTKHVGIQWAMSVSDGPPMKHVKVPDGSPIRHVNLQCVTDMSPIVKLLSSCVELLANLFTLIMPNRRERRQHA